MGNISGQMSYVFLIKNQAIITLRTCTIKNSEYENKQTIHSESFKKKNPKSNKQTGLLTHALSSM